jgi:hypothetical protein
VKLRVFALVCCALLVGGSAHAQELRTRNVILVTLDGVRWKEIFSGADSLLVHDTIFTPESSGARQQFWTTSAGERRRRLMPFFWTTIAAQGQLYGNRTLGSRVDVTNPQRFSYPGYNELLTGFADPRVRSNDKIPNPNRTVLEFLNEQRRMRGEVVVFASWDAMPFIVNEARSGLLVNAGNEPATGDKLSDRESLLNELLMQLPTPWPGVRADALTHQYALEYARREEPRLLYVAFGETDDYAHDRRYAQYLQAAHRADAMIRQLWEWVQSTRGYRDETTLIITTDHGRGDGRFWSDHWSLIEGAQHTWLAVLGPDTPASGERLAGQFYQNQIARTIARLLGYEVEDERMGAVVGPLFKQQSR